MTQPRLGIAIIGRTSTSQTVYQTAWLLEQLDMLRLPKGRVRLVGTKAETKGLMTAREVASKLGLPLSLALPGDPKRYKTVRITRKPLALRAPAKPIYAGHFRGSVQYPRPAVALVDAASSKGAILMRGKLTATSVAAMQTRHGLADAPDSGETAPALSGSASPLGSVYHWNQKPE